MKFDAKLFVIGVIILFGMVSSYQVRHKIGMRALDYALKKNGTNNTKKNKTEIRLGMEEVLNHGFSYLQQKENHFKHVDKLITKGQIFTNQIDFKKGYFGDYIVNEQNYRLAQNRNVTFFNAEEMKKNQQVSVKGRFAPIIGSDLHAAAMHHVIRKPVRSHLYSDTVGKLSLTVNTNKNFPNLHRDFVKAAYKTFYELPNKNSPNHTLDDLKNNFEAIQEAVKFFEHYGTHYIAESIWGYRFGFTQEYKNSDTYERNSSGDYHAINMTTYSFKQGNASQGNATQGSANQGNASQGNLSQGNTTEGNSSANRTIAPPKKAGKNPKPDLNQFYIGECAVDNFFLKPETCNKDDPRLVQFEVTPISYLFKPFLQLKKEFVAGKVTLDNEKLAKMYFNMEFLRAQIQSAMDPNLFVITDFTVFKKVKKDAKSVGCLTVNPAGLKKANKDYKQINGNKYYEQWEFLHDQNLPILTFKNYNQMRNEYQVVTKGEEALYFCAFNRHNLFPHELANGSWKNQKYLENIIFLKDNDVKAYEDVGYECKESWEFENKKRELIRYFMCMKYSNNFINNNLITDIKFFEFDRKMHKCNDRYLHTYINGRRYECDCDLNFREISDTKGQGDTYLCYSRKVNSVYKYVIPNKVERADIKNKASEKKIQETVAAGVVPSK